MMNIDSMAYAFVVVALMAWDSFRRWLATKRVAATEATTREHFEKLLAEQRKDIDNVWRQASSQREGQQVLSADLKRVREQVTALVDKTNEQEKHVKNLHGALSRQQHAKTLRHLSPISKRKGVG